MFDKLFSPITINGLTLKNRIQVSAMCTQYPSDGDGLPTEKWIQYWERKARGGWGLLWTENYGVTEHANSFKKQAGLWCDDQIPAHKEFVSRIHAAGGTIGCQIYHAGRQTSVAAQGVQPVAPSAIREGSMGDTPRALTTEEVWELIGKFGDTARRALECGFDAVEIHCAHGYLINEFLSPAMNRRTDEFGSNIVNRARMMVETIKNVRSKVGPDFPISVRLSTYDGVPGGIELAEAKVYAQMAEAAGADLIHCSQGTYSSREFLISPSVTPKAMFENNVEEIKKVVKIPVVATGRINDPYLADSVISTGKADMVTMARASLADPDMPNKTIEGRYEDIIHCIGCCQGCTGELGRGSITRCMVNPLTGMEDEYDVSPASEPHKVYVAGGGVAGCGAAIGAAEKGHKVTLFEKGAALGGQWLAAATPPGKEEYDSFVVWQKHTLEKLGVDVRLGIELTADIVRDEMPDTVIVATGGTPLMPPIPGLRENALVVPAIDVLLGRVHVAPGKKIVVAGGGLVGAETADFLAVHGARDVSIVEMLPDIMVDGEKSPKKLLNKSLKEYGVHVYTSTKLEEVRESSVLVSSVDEPGDIREIDGLDLVVMALGVRSNNGLADELSGLNCKVIVAGDAHDGKNGFRNIQEGFKAGLEA